MTTFTTTFEGFKKAASDYFKATQDRAALDADQAANGNKALGLMYLGMTDFDELKEHEINHCVVILNLATKREFEVAFANGQTEEVT